MARCMLCSSMVAATDVTCPRCGGAVEEEPGDATQAQGIDLTKVDGPPSAETAWPGEPAGPFAVPEGPPAGPTPTAPPGGWSAPPPADWATGTYPGFTYGPPGFGPPPGYGPPGYAPPPGYGPPPGFGPPADGALGYGPPSDHGAAPGYGPPPGFGPPGFGPPPGYGYGPPVWVPPRPTDGLAIGAFTTSLVGLVTAGMLFVPILACPVGAVLGHLALRRIAENGKQGRGYALAGVIIGWVGTAILVLGTIILVAVIAASASGSG